MSFVQSGAGLASLRAWGTEVAGAAAGTQSMMRYVGSVAGAAMIAGVLGSDPAMGGMRLLLWLVAFAALANFFVALTAFRRGGPTLRASMSVGTSTARPAAGD
jgi:hypothetical protein